MLNAFTTPGGSSSQLQYNNAGVFDGAAALTYATSGGTTGTIADYTIVDYATDAATIRNNLYQLARLVKQDHDALRLYGLLT